MGMIHGNESDGYRIVGLRLKSTHKKRKQKGRTRGRYPSLYMYVRIRYPNGSKRDLYLGPVGPPELRSPVRGAEKPPAPASSSTLVEGGRKGGQERRRMTAEEAQGVFGPLLDAGERSAKWAR